MRTHTSGVSRLAMVLCAGGVVSAAKAQSWTVINLHPAGATNSECRGVYAGQQAGVANNAGAAYVWSGSAATAVKLTPAVPGQASTGITSTLGEFGVGGCVASGQQGGAVSVLSPSQGVGSFSHASLWNGTPGSWVSLHPGDPTVLHTGVYATDGATQVGYYEVANGATFGAPSPALWHGTAGSFVSLLPAGFGSGEARGVNGNQQVGTTDDTGLTQACMWTGTADSFVNLNPEAAFASAANCTDGTHQYGQVAVSDPVPGLFPSVWSGSAESWVPMGPAGRWGEIDATDGGMQAGSTTDTNQEDQRAYVWTGPGLAQDLSVFLPANYTTSAAVGIWRHAASGTTYVVGYAQNTAASNRREAVMWVNGPGVNLITSPAAPADCSAAAGGTLAYSVRVLNAGADASGPVTLTVDLPPAGVATYAQATPAPTNVTATQLTFDVSPLAALGGFSDVSITLNAVGGGATATITASASAAGEMDPTNNTASASSRVQPSAASFAAAKGVLSTVATQANSLVPGGGGARFTAINRPFASPSGGWWAATASTSAASAQNLVLVRSQTGGSPAVIAQKGVTALSHGTLLTCDVGADVNDSGLVAFAGTDNGAAAGNRFIATTDGAAITEIARKGNQIPSMGAGITYSSNVGASANIFANGQVGFSTDALPSSPSSNAYLSGNGNSIVARVGVTSLTAPTGTYPVKAVTTGNTDGGTHGGINFDATGAHSVYQCDLNTGGTTNDTVFVADGAVIMQEGSTTLPGLVYPVDGLAKDHTIGGSGVWLVHGKDAVPTTTPPTTENWVVRGSGSTIAQVYKDGDAIYPGAGEHWGPDGTITGGGLTFFAQLADGQGNYLIGGTTDNPDTFANGVLVLNNQRVIARENDPVDLDGNGVFDDGVYIRSFNTLANNALQDGVAFVNGGVLAIVSLRDSSSALCHSGDASVGTALVFIPISSGCYANCDNSTQAPILNVADFSCFLTRYAVGDPYANCDGSTQSPVLNVADFSCFLTKYAAGCPR
jgi:hypothetical protein